MPDGDAEKLAEYQRIFAENYDSHIRSLISDGRLNKEPSPLAKKKLFAAVSTGHSETQKSVEELIPIISPRSMSAHWKNMIREAENKRYDAEDKAQEAEEAAELVAEMAEYQQHFAANYDAHIEALISEGKLDKEPSPQAKKKLFAEVSKADIENQLSLEELIPIVCPRAMSAYWREMVREETREARKEQNSWDKKNRRGNHAPIIDLEGSIPSRLANELPATARQLSYLRSLGVKDENLLGTIGKRQASVAIDEALKKRESSGKSGCLFWIVVCLIILGTAYFGGR